jgi:hypothetical protein
MMLENICGEVLDNWKAPKILKPQNQYIFVRKSFVLEYLIFLDQHNFEKTE